MNKVTAALGDWQRRNYIPTGKTWAPQIVTINHILCLPTNKRISKKGKDMNSYQHKNGGQLEDFFLSFFKNFREKEIKVFFKFSR